MGTCCLIMFECVGILMTFDKWTMKHVLKTSLCCRSSFYRSLLACCTKHLKPELLPHGKNETLRNAFSNMFQQRSSVRSLFLLLHLRAVRWLLPHGGHGAVLLSYIERVATLLGVRDPQKVWLRVFGWFRNQKPWTNTDKHTSWYALCQMCLDVCIVYCIIN